MFITDKIVLNCKAIFIVCFLSFFSNIIFIYIDINYLKAYETV